MPLKIVDISKKNQAAIGIIVLVAFIYLFPFFIGKVDTPIDVRDVLMYPWRYHVVDKKVESLTLWKGVFPNQKDNVELKILPLNTNNISFKVSLGSALIRKSSDSNYYFSLDFKNNNDPEMAFNFGLQLVNRNTREILVPGFAVSPLEGEKKDWYRAYFSLNKILQNLSSVSELNNFDILLVAKNNSSSKTALLYLADLKLICEDFSKVVKVHDYYINDLIQMFTPFREYYSKSIKQFHIPFWNNYIFTGTEFTSEPQLGYFHPFYFLCYFLLDHFSAHAVITFISFVLSGIGVFLLTRYWNFSYPAALFTSIVYMFHPFNVTWFSYEHMLMNSATLPFLILSYEKALSHPRLINKYLPLSGLLLGLIFLSGHLQYIYYTFIFFFFFAVFKLLLDRKSFVKHICNMFFVSLCGILIGSIVLFPFFPLLFASHRVPNTLAFIRANSFPLKAFMGLLFPFYDGNLSGAHTESKIMDPQYVGGFFNNYIYFGFLPFLFLLVSLKKIISNRFVIFFSLLILLSFLISTGSPVYSLTKELLPGFKQMQHYRFLQIYSYSVPFLAGIGFQMFLNKTSFIKENMKKILILIIFLITIFDLMYYSSFFITWSDRKSYKPLPANGALQFLGNKKDELKEPFRVLPFAIDKVGDTKLKVNIAQPNTLLPYELEDVSGYSSFIPKDIFNLFVYVQTKDLEKLYKNEMLNLFSNPNIPFPIFNFKSKILDLLNVRYFLVPSIITIDPQYAKKVFDGDCAIYENKDCLPRAFFVSDYKVIDSPVDTIQYLDSNGFDPLKTVVLMSEPNVIARSISDETIPGDLRKAFEIASPLARNDNINFLKYGLNKIIINVKVNQAGFLVLGNNLNNNWKVKINGKESKHFSANLVQRAVYLPKSGNYLVEFFYYPKLFFIGLFITCFAIIVLGLLLILSKRLNK